MRKGVPFWGILLVALGHGWLTLTGSTVLGVAHTAPFLPWSFGYYLSRRLPLVCLGELLFAACFTSRKELLVRPLTQDARKSAAISSHALWNCAGLHIPFVPGRGGLGGGLLCVAVRVDELRRAYHTRPVDHAPGSRFLPGYWLCAGASSPAPGLPSDGGGVPVGRVAPAYSRQLFPRQLFGGYPLTLND